MKEDKKIYIHEIQRALQQRMKYPRNKQLSAFNTLFYGWAKRNDRLGIRLYNATISMYTKGWMNIANAQDFCDYCITRWNPVPEILKKRK